MTFESSNPEVATVDERGLIHGLKTGTATITADSDTTDPVYMTVIVRNAFILQLPAGLQRIEPEAFAGSACEVVIIPDGCPSIGAKAFANCTRLIRIILPSRDVQIAGDAFEGSDNVTFFRDED